MSGYQFYNQSTTKARFLGTQPLSGLWGTLPGGQVITKFFSSPLPDKTIK